MTARDTWVRPTTTHIVDALDNARELIRNGWCQHIAHTAGRYDINGAIARTAGTIRISWPIHWDRSDAIPGQIIPGTWIRDAATAALMQALPQRFGTLAAYNDQPDRTQDEVVGLFNQAINTVKAVVV